MSIDRSVGGTHRHEAAGRGSTAARRAYRNGLNVSAVLLGVLGLVVAILALAGELGGVDLARSDIIPIVVLGAGAGCVAAGVIGLIATALRRR